MQGAGDPGAGQRLAAGVLLADGHQPGHLVLGQGDLLASETCQTDVGDLVLVLDCGCAHESGFPSTKKEGRGGLQSSGSPCSTGFRRLETAAPSLEKGGAISNRIFLHALHVRSRVRRVETAAPGRRCPGRGDPFPRVVRIAESRTNRAVRRSGARMQQGTSS